VSKQIKKKIILIGYKSFIQTHLRNHLSPKYNVKNIRFENINHKVLEDCSMVINCSNTKSFFEKKYSKKNDRNFILSNLLKKKNVKFILLSTRQVYFPKFNITEKSKLAPINVYAKNCLNSEKFCKEKLRNNLLVLRLSNVVGVEDGKKKKPSFMSLIIKGLKKNQIIIDDNLNLYKDFIPIELLCLYIEKLIEKNVFGMINVGIGKSILVKDFLTNILGKRQVKLVFKKNNKFSDRSYSFNIKKLQNLTGIKIKKKILNSCFNDLKVMINNSYD
jgi:dTDP-4-dehydrorhamnose reductase